MAADFVQQFRKWLDDHRDRMWSEEIWPRSFWFDAFLSHRRSDWSRELAAALTSRGARVYHDNDVAVLDKQVEFELDNALKHSRFVVVCLTPEFANSFYGRLEYPPAAKHSASAGIPRVLVARQDDTRAPDDLHDATVFDVRAKAGVDALAAFIITQNRVAFPERATPAIQPADVFPRDGTERIEQLDRTILGSTDIPPKEFALREVGLWAQAVLSGKIESVETREQALGAAYIHVVRDGVVSPDWHDYLWRCAFVMMHSPRRDPAEIGVEVFLWDARHGTIADERQLIISRIWAETSHNGRPNVCAQLLDRDL